MAKKKQYSKEQRYYYHLDRFLHPENRKIGNKSPKRYYSEGFIDAFIGRDNSGTILARRGSKALFAYRQGRRIGLKASAK